MELEMVSATELELVLAEALNTAEVQDPAPQNRTPSNLRL
jgi:hypothetical protein